MTSSKLRNRDRVEAKYEQNVHDDQIAAINQGNALDYEPVPLAGPFAQGTGVTFEDTYDPVTGCAARK